MHKKGGSNFPFDKLKSLLCCFNMRKNILNLTFKFYFFLSDSRRSHRYWGEPGPTLSALRLFVPRSVPSGPRSSSSMLASICKIFCGRPQVIARPTPNQASLKTQPKRRKVEIEYMFKKCYFSFSLFCCVLSSLKVDTTQCIALCIQSACTYTPTNIHIHLRVL